MEIYRIENLTFTYPGHAQPALDDVYLTIRRGEFITLCGPSGCGKTTLLRQLKPALAPHGDKRGAIFFGDSPLTDLPAREQAARVGFVQQSPENQIVTDKVWHELAFGLESLGYKTPEIRLRVAEMASFFGIQTWFHKPVTELSGGQKQLLNLASVMAMQPSVLMLDEPTSRLDPIAAGEFLAALSKLNRELGVTVLLSEHRLEEAFPLSDRVIVMDEGRVIADGTPREAAWRLREREHSMFLAMPTAIRAGVAIDNGQLTMDNCPLTVREGMNWLAEQAAKLGIDNGNLSIKQTPAVAPKLSIAVSWDEVWFKYGKAEPDVLRGLSFAANYGEITAMLGGNGAGKTTALSLVARLHTPYRGKVLIDGREVSGIPKLFDGLLGVLPQDPQALFVKKTVREDLLEILAEQKLSKEETQKRLANIIALCHLHGLLDYHPYDLSGGEQQRAALAKVLLLRPKILLLDEPTKGLDAGFKQIFAGILRNLTSGGAAVVLVSHDVEFCAAHADRCALVFDGSIVSEGAPKEFFSGNSFYTTAANRMARELLPAAVTVHDIVEQLTMGNGQLTMKGGELGGVADESAGGFVGRDVHIAPQGLLPEQLTIDNGQLTMKGGELGGGTDEFAGGFVGRDVHIAPQTGFTRGRGIFTVAPLILLVATVVFAAFNFEGLKSFVAGGGEAVLIAANRAAVWRYAGIMLALTLELAALVLALSWRRDKPVRASVKRKLSKRTVAAVAMILLAIPLTIYLGTYFFGDRKYYFTSLLIILETMLPFALVFESRKPQARELVVIAVLCAIAVAGRTAFFMLPQFKPVVALVIIAAVAFGGEAGFLVGAMTGFVSNFFLGQGPWTPWQMFAFGVSGFLAGLLFRKGLLRRGRIPLALFGGLVTLVIYGGIMNPAHVLIFQPRPTREMFLISFLQGLPLDLVHSAATAIFMLIISQPMLEKLDRIKVKYGLVE